VNAVDCRESEKQYAGPLNAAQIAAGMNAAQDNAARLLADSELLLGAERYPTAASVAILAIEEVRKISTLRRMAMRSDDSYGRNIGQAAVRTATRSFQIFMAPPMSRSPGRDPRPIVRE